MSRSLHRTARLPKREGWEVDAGAGAGEGTANMMGTIFQIYWLEIQRKEGEKLLLWESSAYLTRILG